MLQHFCLNTAYSESIDKHCNLQAIEYLQNLLEYDGSWDARLNFQNGGNTSQLHNGY